MKTLNTVLANAAKRAAKGAAKHAAKGAAIGAAMTAALCAPLAAHADGTPIIVAAGAGQTAAVIALLDQGASPDAHGADGLTPLMAAAANGHFETVQALMIHGAHKELADASGRTAYDYAVQKRAIDIVGLLRDGS